MNCAMFLGQIAFFATNLLVFCYYILRNFIIYVIGLFISSELEKNYLNLK